MNLLIKSFSAFFLTIILIKCTPNYSCTNTAKITYNLGLNGCEYLFLIDGQLYEAENLDEWQNFLFYTDTQEVMIEYQYLNDFSLCSGLEKIDVFCLTNI
tara:strand:- start:151 stop:450 length:300 start_codon:yes stop_codon:yes gene_type:complete